MLLVRAIQTIFLLIVCQILSPTYRFLSSLFCFYFQVTEALVCLPCAVLMYFLRVLLFYVYLFFSHLLFIFTSPYFPLPNLLPWLYIPLPDIPAIPSRLRSYIPPSLFSLFPRRPPIPPKPPASQDAQDSSSDHSSPPALKHSGRGKGKGHKASQVSR